MPRVRTSMAAIKYAVTFQEHRFRNCPVQQLHACFSHCLMSLISEQCSQYLLSNNEQSLLYYQSISGIGYNKLGSYLQCVADPRSQYYLINATSQVAAQQTRDIHFMTGICFSRLCSAADLQYALHAFESYSTVPFVVQTIETPSQIQAGFDIWTVLIISLLGLLLLAALISTFVYWLISLMKWDRHYKIVEIFSLCTTIKMLQTRSEPTTDRIKIFSGLKVLSLLGIMLTHVALIVYLAPITEIEPSSAAYFALFYCIDVWLMISGFFLSYLLMKQYAKLQSIRILLLKIARRFLRLWPLYILSLFFNWKILAHLGEGPLWPFIVQFPDQSCDVQYTWNIFMAGNTQFGRCFNWLWLFEVDIQLCLFFTSLLLVYIRFTSRKARALFYSLQVVTLIASVVSQSLLNVPMPISEYYYRHEFFGLSITPFGRVGAYVVGYNLGLMFFEFRKLQDKHKFWLMPFLRSKISRCLFCAVPLLVITIFTYWLHTLSGTTLGTSSFFVMTSLRTLIPLLFAIIILPDLFGYQSPLKTLFESSTCNLLSKLSLSLYAVHYSVQLFLVYHRQSDLQLSNKSSFFLCTCSIIPSLILSVLITTLIEIPVFVCKKMYWQTERITYFEH